MKKAIVADQMYNQVISSPLGHGDPKKKSIIESTIRILSTEGIEHLTFETIGKKLGTTKANVRYHFRDKEELIFTAFKLVMLNGQTITVNLVEKAATAVQKLDGVIEGAFIWAKNFPEHFCCWSMYLYYSTIYTRYMKIFAEIRAMGSNRIALFLRALPRKGIKKTEPDFLALAEEIQNIITGQAIGFTTSGGHYNHYLNRTRKIVRLLLKEEGVEWP